MEDEKVIEGYHFLEEIGRGGMGCVYKGTSPSGETVAIKMMDNQYCFDPEVRRLFFNEVESLKELHHPSVVGVKGHAFQDSHGNIYMPMEYVDGETLKQKVKRDGPFDEQAARDLMAKILDAFSYIHGQKKVHRDIKPSNIMIRPNGEISVIDFGIVKDMTTSTGKTVGMIVGTDGYMSPEQVSGLNIDYRTDIYSLGCLLHYMLTGSHAIAQKTNDVATKISILKDDFPSAKQMRPELSDDIQAIIYKAVDKNMTKRFQTAGAFKAAIEGRTVFDGAKVTIGKMGNCDIVVPNQYVSRYHLTIRYKHLSNGPIIEIEDDSTNGTGVDGKYLHKGSMSFPFDLKDVMITHDVNEPTPKIQYLKGDNTMPEVFLAGRSEIKLDWDEVLVKLHERIPQEFANNTITSTPQSDPAPTPTPSPKPNDDDKLNVGLGILSFLFPIVGWILSSSMKDAHPKAAKAAGKLGWGGFLLEIVIELFIFLFS